jgi:hypothetical protein
VADPRGGFLPVDSQVQSLATIHFDGRSKESTKLGTEFPGFGALPISWPLTLS